MLSLLLIISGFNLLLPITGILLLFLDVSVVFHIILLLFSKMSYILEAFLDTSAVSFGIGSGTSIFLGTSSSLNKSIVSSLGGSSFTSSVLLAGLVVSSFFIF